MHSRGEDDIRFFNDGRQEVYPGHDTRYVRYFVLHTMHTIYLTISIYISIYMCIYLFYIYIYLLIYLFLIRYFPPDRPIIFRDGHNIQQSPENKEQNTTEYFISFKIYDQSKLKLNSPLDSDHADRKTDTQAERDQYFYYYFYYHFRLS